MAKRVPQTKVFPWQSAYWFWNFEGKKVGPFKLKVTAFKQLENYLRYHNEANKVKNK